jgi:uncharacterized protein with NAD-binding domain and iron-sulfur cluster
MKVIIIGGGYAGLACASILCEQPNIEVELYEKEFSLGGQARSMYTNKCNVEYCWRVFGKCYHNVWYLFDKIGIKENFSKLNSSCILDKSISDGQPDTIPIFKKILKDESFSNYYKYIDFLFLCKERTIHEYDHVNLMNYFNQNEMIKSLAGPYVGMESKRISVSSFMKYLYSVSDNKSYPFSSPDVMITNKPTSDAIFDPWEKWLIKKGVRIYKNAELQNIEIDKEIQSVQINNEIHTADEYLFACSLKNINNLLPSSCKTFKDMKILETDLQLYFSFNLYFSEKIDMDCDLFVINDEGWQPMIQRKTLWKKEITKHCNENIKEIWNVAFLDLYKGTYNKKYVSECSIEEAIQEGLLEIKQNHTIKKLLKKPFDEIVLDYEYWYEFKNKNGKITVENPKFSVNEGTSFLLPSSQPEDIPKNMYLAGYYTESTQGGASMESSTETGMNAAKKILNKYNIPCDKPIKHTNNALELHYLLIPFILFDYLLYQFKLKPITTYINSVLLLVVYVSLLFYFLIRMVTSKTTRKFFKGILLLL